MSDNSSIIIALTVVALLLFRVTGCIEEDQNNYRYTQCLEKKTAEDCAPIEK